MHAAFLAAILAEPDVDLHRLVYADWLDEDGQPARAEFVRVQCRIAQIDAEVQSGEDCDNPGCPSCAERRPLRRRERELFERRPVGAWEGSVLASIQTNEFGPVYAFRRGFVESVTGCAAADWLAHGDAIRAAQPVTRVKLTTVPRVVRGLDEKYYLYGLIPTPVIAWRVTAGLALASEQALRLLAERWPGVAFELPPVGYHLDY